MIPPNEPPADEVARPKPVLPPTWTANAMDDAVIIRPSSRPGYVEVVRCLDDVTSTLNGSALLSATDSFNSTATNVGMTTSSGTSRLDNFSRDPRRVAAPRDTMNDDSVGVAFFVGAFGMFLLILWLSTCGMNADEGARYARCRERGGVAIFVQRQFKYDSIACVKGEVLKTTAPDTLP